ncbi:porin [Paraflavitalea sp. CAU 1676]|uniref:porin n=1 Tax=Paraflavitalea sp. CAU 1676 TaxID=3032598 RepID=UPI0023DA62A5|nr:porin [Paraflavitalea sp. CAU 1676]MDF2187724.1 porin [Paraflavitalea sp. CAU 1676]
MSNTIVVLSLLLSCTASFGQKQMQIDTFAVKHPLIPEAKQKLLSNIDVIANMQSSLRNEFVDGEYTKGRFIMNQFRLELKGKIHDRVYFRFRDRYTKNTDPQSEDNMSSSTDLAYIQVQASNKLSFTIGKLCADWGGIEFDMNPIDIYQYSDIVEYSDNFLLGMGLQWQASENHSFSFQALNSRTRTFEEIYGTVPGITESKFPYAAVANWRGTLLGDKLSTIWSYSIFKEASNTYMYYVALGNQLSLGRFQLAYDFKYSKEDLDRKGIFSTFTDPTNTQPAAQDVLYASHWLKADYRIGKINLSAVGMVDFANWKGNPDPNKENKLRTAWGYIPTVEYFPFKNFNLKFFVNYVGRVYRYTDYAKNRFGAVNSNTGVISLGFIAPLHVL